MCTWIVHLRVADTYIKRGIIPDKYKTEFIIGSVAPDCGYGTKDVANTFVPPPSVTHLAPDGNKRHCDYKKFYDIYLSNKTQDGAYFFALGYYIHLISDVLWSEHIYMPIKAKFERKTKHNPRFMQTVKKSWQNPDFDFLRQHPDFEPYKLLCENKQVDDYLPFYEPGQLTTQTRYIADYYRDFEHYIKETDTLCLTETDIENFIEMAWEFTYNLCPGTKNT